jgi:hypothetical protein
MEIILNLLKNRYRFVERQPIFCKYKALYWLLNVFVIIIEWVYFLMSNNPIMHFVIPGTVVYYVVVDLLLFHRLEITPIEKKKRNDN